jgi:hypothetical protein
MSIQRILKEDNTISESFLPSTAFPPPIPPLTGPIIGQENDSLSSGFVGELQTGTSVVIVLTSLTPINLNYNSILGALSAGDWLIWGVGTFTGNANTAINYVGIQSTGPGQDASQSSQINTDNTFQSASLSFVPFRVSTTDPSTLQFKVDSLFSGVGAQLELVVKLYALRMR